MFYLFLEFIKNVASEANQLCLRDGKKTISPDFIFNALKELKLEEYLPELIVSHNNYLDETNVLNIRHFIFKYFF